MNYQNKRVLVSGCFSGMGAATAKQLLEAGAEVHGVDYKPTTLALASFTPLDLRDPESIDAAVAKIGGRIDALFNCAGLPHTFPAMEVMKVNYAGTRRLTERVIPLMPSGSAIASISSNGGLGWSRRLPTLLEFLEIDDFDAIMRWCSQNPEHVGEGYAFSKEAVIAWTLQASNSLIHRGIRINCIMPGPTQTPMTAELIRASSEAVMEAAAKPIGRRSRPEEQAAPLVFLNSEGASYINGVALPVDGGFMGGLATGQIDVREMMANARS